MDRVELGVIKFMAKRLSPRGQPTPPTFPFMWRDRKGNFHLPAEMATRHLFYVVRMIWNHSIPFKLEPYRRYNFNSFYTAPYMQAAIKIMVPELAKRDDLTDDWAADLDKMASWLKTNQFGNSAVKNLETDQ